MEPQIPTVVNPVPTTPTNGESGNNPGGSGLPSAPIVTPTSGSQAPGAPGSQTPSELLLASLQEERRKRKELEDELQNLRSANPGDTAWSDEGKLLQNQIVQLQTTITSFEENNTKKALQDSNPVLRDKWVDFELYRQKPENKGMSMSTAAKAYLIDNGMFDQPRAGLESPSGGPRTPVSGALTPEEIKQIRETDPRKYREMLEKGQIAL